MTGERNPTVGTRRVAHPLSARFELMLVAAAWLTYFGTRALAEGQRSEAMARGRSILRLEEDLGLSWEHEAQGLLEGRDWLLDVANWIYVWGHWPVIVACGIWLFRRHPPAYRRLRDAIFVSGGIGLAIFALLPVAPPRLLDAGLLDTVTQHSTSYRALQPPALTNVYAAMPSLHFGWDLLVGITVAGVLANRWLRGAAIAMPLGMAFAVVTTGNHFVVDVIAGGALALVGLGVAIRLQPSIRDEPRAAPPAVDGSAAAAEKGWPRGSGAISRATRGSP